MNLSETILHQISEAELQNQVSAEIVKSTGAASRVTDPGQTLVPVKDFTDSRHDWRAAGGVFVVYSKNVKRITLQRVLCSRLVFEKEKFVLRDLLVIFDNLLVLQDQCLKDEGFRNKFGSSLEELAKILKNSRIGREPTRAGLTALSKKLADLEGFLIPHRNLAHTEKYFIGKYEVRQGVKLGIPNSELPVKRYIGIGYRDKGTARDLAFNGEPRWQDYCKMRLWDNIQ